MKSEDFIAKLRELGLPVVTVDTASSILQKNRFYSSLYLRRLSNSGLLNVIERGKFCIAKTDEYTIASRLIPDSYITGYAALEHYRLTTQTTSLIQVIAGNYHRHLKLQEHEVEFSVVKKQYLYGFSATSFGPVFADPEKIFIDDFYLHGRFYYMEELETAIQEKRIDIEKLRRYAALSGKASIKEALELLLSKSIIKERPAAAMDRNYNYEKHSIKLPGSRNVSHKDKKRKLVKV